MRIKSLTRAELISEAGGSTTIALASITSTMHLRGAQEGVTLAKEASKGPALGSEQS
jgi:hypothetical protein